ncbi:MAG: prepilin-type N-terminal cleavage/methylation domain-containing protein [Holophagales bacterium]|nr:prepilin-type N-terminal cleavage/methylation domain-containing protein [Holophagales bacterium]
MIFEHPLARRRASLPKRCLPKRCREQAGLTLIEVLFSLLILLVIALSVIPLFSRAIQSNRRGALATQVASFMSSSAEQINQTVINHPKVNEGFLEPNQLKDQWTPTGEGATSLTPNAPKIDEALRLFTASDFYGTGQTIDLSDKFNGLPTAYYATGPVDAIGAQDAVLGDERWVTEAEYIALGNNAGKIHFLRDVLFFNYDMSDVHSGTISTSANPDATTYSLVTVGNRRLFDNPLPWNANDTADIREVRVAVRRPLEGTPSGTGAMLVVFGHYRAF